MSTTVHLGTNVLRDCETLIGLKEHALLRVKTDPLRVTLSTPPDTAPETRVQIVDNIDQDQAPGKGEDQTRITAGRDTITIVRRDIPLLVATMTDQSNVLLRLDLRPLGIQIYDDAYGLHVGGNQLAKNQIEQCMVAIGLR